MKGHRQPRRLGSREHRLHQRIEHGKIGAHLADPFAALVAVILEDPVEGRTDAVGHGPGIHVAEGNETAVLLRKFQYLLVGLQRVGTLGIDLGQDAGAFDADLVIAREELFRRREGHLIAREAGRPGDLLGVDMDVDEHFYLSNWFELNAER